MRRNSVFFQALVFFGLLLPGAEARAFTLSYSSALQGWQGTTLTFKTNFSNCGMPVAELYSAVDQALELWNTVPTSRLRLERGDEVTTTVAQALAGSAASGLPTPLLICDPDMENTFRVGVSPNLDPDPAFSSNNIPAVTVQAPTALTLDYAVLVLNSESGRSARVSNLVPTTLAVVLAHEIGHVLGLGHTADPVNLMYYDATARTRLSLSQDDMDGVAYLYPRGEPGQNGLFGCGTLTVGGEGPPRGPHGGVAALAEFGMVLVLAALGTRFLKSKTWRMA